MELYAIFLIFGWFDLAEISNLSIILDFLLKANLGTKMKKIFTALLCVAATMQWQMMHDN